MPIRADARVLGASLKAGETTEYRFAKGRYGYLVASKGKVVVNGIDVATRDGAPIRDEELITVTASDDAELVLVDSAPSRHGAAPSSTTVATTRATNDFHDRKAHGMTTITTQDGTMIFDEDRGSAA